MNALSEGHNVDEILLDMSKAFDLVPHIRLIHKIRGYGASNELTVWLDDFLKNRSQRVVLADSILDWKAVLSGVPQGSVLGPLLFVLYIYDLPEVIGNNMKLYADDSKILAIVDTIVERKSLQEDLDAISVWVRDWKMKLNIAKSKVVHFGKSNLKTKYQIQDECLKYKILETSESERDLGIIVSSNFKWKRQINPALSKANMLLGMLVYDKTSPRVRSTSLKLKINR